MADVLLIISMIVAFGILVIMGVYLLVYYQHPDDHNDAYFPKIVVIGGFVLAGATVLLLPLDVANREGYPGPYLLYECSCWGEFWGGCFQILKYCCIHSHIYHLSLSASFCPPPRPPIYIYIYIYIYIN